MPRTVLNVFLSSTAIDFDPHREEIYQRLMETGLFHCVCQRNFGPQNAGAIEFCRRNVREADLFVGLVGLRRGWEPEGNKARRSITEMEHNWARKYGINRYIWVAPEDFFVRGNIRENDGLYKRQQAFRKSVMANGARIVSQNGFESPALLAADVVGRLLIEVVTSDRIRDVRPELFVQGGGAPEDQRPAIAAAFERLAEDRDVDLLALAKNPKEVDPAEHEAKLKARAEKLGAESAGYWRHIGALAFLHDTQKALAAYERAVVFDPGNPEGWRYLGELQYRLGDLPAAEKSFATLRGFAEDRSRSMGCTRLGWIYRVRGDLVAAEAIISEAIDLAERAQWTEGQARAYRNLGHIYHTRGDLDRAEEMLLKALALEEALGSEEGVARAYGNLGLIYEARGELDRAEEMLLKALALNEALRRWEGMAAAYGNLGLIYQTRGDLDRAEEMQLKSLALEETLGRKDGMAAAYGNLGLIYQKRGELDRAEEMQLKSLALEEGLGGKEGMAITNGNLATIYQARNELGLMCDCKRKERSLWREMGLEAKALKAEQWLRDAGCEES